MGDLLFFIPACFALNLAFGPNNLMALTNGAQRGVGFAVLAASSRIMAFAPMIAISALGLGVVLSTSALVFTAIKLGGAAYLIWLGIKLLRHSGTASSADISSEPVRFKDAFRREGLVAMGNPKAILIFAAFFPQFVDVDAYAQSYLTLGAIFLLLEVGAIAVYASVGHFAARAASHKLHYFQRASGFGMIVFGGLLLLTKRPDMA
jgi:threonine/homoserine/homoserine lactone efflux protein